MTVTSTTPNVPQNLVPSNMSFLRDIGLSGWERTEATVLAALVCQLPLLLVGSHGTAKTDGTRAISRAILGSEDAAFVKYDTPIAQIDDVLGFLDVRSLQNGEIDYLKLPTSIWNAEAVMFDEFNRCNPLTAGKYMELTRTGQVHGRQTSVQYRFAGCNPVRGYKALYMDLAQASRWVIVRVPEVRSMTNDEIDSALDATLSYDHKAGQRLRELVLQARAAKVDPAIHAILRSVVRDVLKKINQSDDSSASVFNTQIRQGQAMLNLLDAYHKIRTITGDAANSHDMINIIISCIPEVHGICDSSADPAVLQTLIRPILEKVKFPDSLPQLTTLHDLILHRDTKDKNSWIAYAKTILDTVVADTTKDHSADIAAFDAALQDMLRRKIITEDGFNVLYGTIIESMPLRLDGPDGDLPIGANREGLRTLIERRRAA